MVLRRFSTLSLGNEYELIGGGGRGTKGRFFLSEMTWKLDRPMQSFSKLLRVSKTEISREVLQQGHKSLAAGFFAGYIKEPDFVAAQLKKGIRYRIRG